MNGINSSCVDESVDCPLCMEPLEVDDLNFYPCTCGYQVSSREMCTLKIRKQSNVSVAHHYNVCDPFVVDLPILLAPDSHRRERTVPGVPQSVSGESGRFYAVVTGTGEWEKSYPNGNCQVALERNR